MDSTISLFRRHEAACSEAHPKDLRVYEDDSLKNTGKAQCRCPIYAEGTLRKDGVSRYVRPTSTRTREWSKARKVVADWTTWGSTEPPVQVRQEPEYQLRSVEEAVEQYFATLEANGISDGRLQQLRQLLENRLIPYAASVPLKFIQQMDCAEAWGGFRLSWKNENPTKNRKPRPEDAGKVVKLGRRTERRMVDDLRAFLNFCISREWLSDNWASRKHKMNVIVGVDPKEPFTDEEIDYVYRASDLVTDGKGFKRKRTGTPNGKEALAFAYVLRYTGLRISDVVLLESERLVPFNSGRYTHAIYCNPKKTANKKGGNFVHIPIPNGNFPGEPNVVAALQALPLKHRHYFFLGGGPLPQSGTDEWEARVKSATSGWRERIDRLFRLATKLMAEDGMSFSHHPHPHRFRHTFASTLLKEGVSLRIVAQYLGDTEDMVRTHYAKFCVAEQVEAAKVLEEAMLRRANKRQELQKARMTAASDLTR